jgi:hypothetical protein
MSSIFVSYASVDRARVEPFVRALEAHGFDVWWDRDISYGDSYHRVIEQALKGASCAIVVWSTQSVGSEWVTNEASEARKRGILVPVLLDEVEPPLEFRHLQSARLPDWAGAAEDPLLQQLIGAVRRVAERGSVTVPPATDLRPTNERSGKSWWETPAGWAVGGAALLLAAGFFVLALRGAGLFGSPASSAAVDSPPTAGRTETATTSPAAPASSPAGVGNAAARSSGAINLLDLDEAAQIVAASEAGWKDYIFGQRKLYCSVISTGGFVTFAFRGERPARFDRFGIFVDYTSSSNVKTVELHVSDESERGPFRKIGTFTVPNYRNERQPFHEFALEAVTARYVKFVIVDWQNPNGPNGNVCTMELLGTLQ